MTHQNIGTNYPTRLKSSQKLLKSTINYQPYIRNRLALIQTTCTTNTLITPRKTHTHTQFSQIHKSLNLPMKPAADGGDVSVGIPLLAGNGDNIATESAHQLRRHHSVSGSTSFFKTCFNGLNALSGFSLCFLYLSKSIY